MEIITNNSINAGFSFKDIDYVKCSFKDKDNSIVFEVIKNNNDLKINIIENNGFIII